jgi:hypothetical protein
MFCSIEDAWGDTYLDYKPEMIENNKPENFENTEYKFKKINNNVQNERTFGPSLRSSPLLNDFQEKSLIKGKDNEYNKYVELKEKFEDIDKNKTDICMAVENHILNCEYCKRKYKGNNLNIENYINNNKESINIFLIGLLIICFFYFFRNV